MRLGLQCLDRGGIDAPSSAGSVLQFLQLQAAIGSAEMSNDSTGVAKRRCAIGSIEKTNTAEFGVLVFSIDPVAPVGLRSRPTRRIVSR